MRKAVKGVLTKILFTAFSSTLLLSCTSKNNIDIDLSNLPKPKIIEPTDKLEKDLTKTDDKLLIKDLVTLKDREELLSDFKFGKKDPFSLNVTQTNKFLSDFELTGFLNTEIEKYVFVRYLGKEGTISNDSIGGLNTEFLPDGAKVINIDIKKRQLEINFDNEDYLFEF